MNQWPHQQPGFGMPQVTRIVKAILIANIAGFVLQLFGGIVLGSPEELGGSISRFNLLFGLSWIGLKQLWLWQLVTYMFLHGGLMHLLFNMLALFFLGPEVERTLGGRQFMILYFGCGILGGLGWLLLSFGTVGYCVGASGAVYGMIGAFGGLYPNRELSFFVFPIPIPIKLKARTLALGLLGFSFVMMLSASGGVAHAAHLVGGIAGYLYGRKMGLRVFHGQSQSGGGIVGRIADWLESLENRIQRRPARPFDRAQPGPPTQTEVDAVLDKLARSGWSSLSKKDRELLDRASKGEQS
jgi:membrane associated rhomboid family serine protease